MAEFTYNSQHLALEILYEDDCMMVVNKPPGLLSVPGTLPELQDSVITRINQKYPEAQAVHRLDMATSGILLISLTKQADAELKRQFRQRLVKKHYFARIRGKLDIAHQYIELPLATDWPLRPRQKVDFVTGKYSLTECTLGSYNQEYDYTHVILSPHTGRSHQLRVHMLAIGHAIVGDKFYDNEYFTKRYHRLCLHAGMIEFSHPVTQQKMHFTAPVDFDYDYQLDRFDDLDNIH